jgi:hypothetical protein
MSERAFAASRSKDLAAARFWSMIRRGIRSNCSRQGMREIVVEPVRRAPRLSGSSPELKR